MDFMLQRKMDSSADYGTPLVVTQKGWFQNFFDNKKITEKIPVISSKVSDKNEFWNKLKYLINIETPIRIIGFVVLGTLIGAAYAVTIKNDNSSPVKVTVSTPDTQEVIAQELMTASTSIAKESSTSSLDFSSNNNETSIITALKEPEIDAVINEFSFPEGTESEGNDRVTLALKSPAINQNEAKTTPSFKLVSADRSFKITQPKTFNVSKKVIDEATYTSIIIPKELIPDVVESKTEAGLSKQEQKRIKELEKKLALAKKKLESFDLENLKLQGKFETLVVKNRALSDQLRHIDTVTTELRNR